MKLNFRINLFLLMLITGLVGCVSDEVKTGAGSNHKAVLEGGVKTAQGTMLTYLNDLFFKTDSAKISVEGFQKLKMLADYLIENPRRTMIEGHTDNRGDLGYNAALSQRRADAVRVTLIRFGVAEHLLSARGYGESRPVADNETIEGRQKNRRVEITLLDE